MCSFTAIFDGGFFAIDSLPASALVRQLVYVGMPTSVLHEWIARYSAS